MLILTIKLKLKGYSEMRIGLSNAGGSVPCSWLFSKLL